MSLYFNTLYFFLKYLDEKYKEDNEEYEESEECFEDEDDIKTNNDNITNNTLCSELI